MSWFSALDGVGDDLEHFFFWKSFNMKVTGGATDAVSLQFCGITVPALEPVRPLEWQGTANADSRVVQLAPVNPGSGYRLVPGHVRLGVHPATPADLVYGLTAFQHIAFRVESFPRILLKSLSHPHSVVPILIAFARLPCRITH